MEYLPLSGLVGARNENSEGRCNEIWGREMDGTLQVASAAEEEYRPVLLAVLKNARPVESGRLHGPPPRCRPHLRRQYAEAGLAQVWLRPHQPRRQAYC